LKLPAITPSESGFKLAVEVVGAIDLTRCVGTE